MPSYAFNLCVENTLALSSRSQHFMLLHISYAEKSEVGGDLKVLKQQLYHFKNKPEN